MLREETLSKQKVPKTNSEPSCLYFLGIFYLLNIKQQIWYNRLSVNTIIYLWFLFIQSNNIYFEEKCG